MYELGRGAVGLLTARYTKRLDCRKKIDLHDFSCSMQSAAKHLYLLN